MTLVLASLLWMQVSPSVVQSYQFLGRRICPRSTSPQGMSPKLERVYQMGLEMRLTAHSGEQICRVERARKRRADRSSALNIYYRYDYKSNPDILKYGSIIQSMCQAENETHPFNLHLDNNQAINQSPIKQLFYLFVNTKSGDHEGRKIIGYRSADLSNYLQPHTHLQIIDLFDHSSRSASMAKLKSAIDEQKVQAKIIICGGDGTLSWVINELIEHSVDLSKCHLGMIPIGTGNELWRGLGCSIKSFDFSLPSFAKQIRKWTQPNILHFDVWDTRIETYENGKIVVVKDRKQIERGQTVLALTFLNFVGLGLDARIIHNVQKIRTPLACINKILYACTGIFNFLRPIATLKSKIASFIQTISPLENAQSDPLQQRLSNSQGVNIAQSLLNKYKGFVCLNGSSYMDGVQNIWKTNTIATEGTHKPFEPHSVNDGKVEFVAYQNQFFMALGRCIHTGAKITQGAGPFQIIFKPTEDDSVTYLQVDGESIKTINLKSIRIFRTEKIVGHQIKVMVEQSTT